MYNKFERGDLMKNVKLLFIMALGVFLFVGCNTVSADDEVVEVDSFSELYEIETAINEIELAIETLESQLDTLLADESIIDEWESLGSPTHILFDASVLDESLGDISQHAYSLSNQLEDVYESLISYAMVNPYQFPIICDYGAYISNCPEFDPNNPTAGDERFLEISEVKRLELGERLIQIMNPFWDGYLG